MCAVKRPVTEFLCQKAFLVCIDGINGSNKAITQTLNSFTISSTSNRATKTVETSKDVTCDNSNCNAAAEAFSGACFI